MRAQLADDLAELLGELRDLRLVVVGGILELTCGDRGKSRLQVLEVTQQRVVDPVGAPELGFELADTLLALCSRFVVEVLGTLLEQLVRLGTTDRR